MEELLKDIKTKLDEMESRSERVEGKIDKYQKDMEKITIMNTQLRAENRKLQTTVEYQEKRMESLEKEIRKRKMIIYGIPDTEEQSDLELRERIRQILKEVGVTINMETEVQEARRLGGYIKDKVRPTLLELVMLNKKTEILANSKKLKGSNIWFAEDLTTKERQHKRDLLECMKELRKQGHLVYLVGNKLKINGKKYTLEQLREEPKDNNVEGQEEGRSRKKGRTISQRSPQELTEDREEKQPRKEGQPKMKQAEGSELFAEIKPKPQKPRVWTQTIFPIFPSRNIVDQDEESKITVKESRTQEEQTTAKKLMATKFSQTSKMTNKARYMDNEESEVYKKQRKNEQTENNKLVIGFWNVQGLNKQGKVKQLIKEAAENKIDILMIQETHIKGTSTTKIDNYYWFNGGGKESSFGTGFLIRENIKEMITDYKVINERISYIRIKGVFRKYVIVNVHAPTNDKDIETKEQFYDVLGHLLDGMPSFDTKIVAGDLNAKIGKEEENWSITGRESLHNKTNENGQMLVNFAASRNMINITTWNKRKDIHKMTWAHPDNVTKNQIDHMLITRVNMNCIGKIRTYRGAEVGSDHYLVKAILKQQKPQLREKFLRKKKRDLSALEKEVERQKYQDKSEELIESTEKAETAEEEWKRIKEVLEKSAEVIQKGKSKYKTDWFDEECEKEIRKKKEAKKRMLASNNEETRRLYKEARNRVNSTCREKKREMLNKKMEELQQNFNYKNTREFYKSLKKEKSGYSTRVTCGLRDAQGQLCMGDEKIMQIWESFYKALLVTQEEEEAERFETEEREEERLPTWSEFTDVIKKMKNNKTPGEDEINIELIKYSDGKVATRIYELIREVWRKKEIPREWTMAIISPIHKNGDPEITENYRPISVLNTIYKIFTSLINKRLQEEAKEVIGDYQCGFKKGKSVVDHIWVIKQIEEMCNRKNIKVQALFIDFRKAYDTIKRKEVIRALIELKFSSKIIELVQKTLENTANKIKFQGRTSRIFFSNVGLRQGDPLSTTLFNIVLEALLRRSNINTNYFIPRHAYQCLAYADDVVFLCRTKQELENVVAKLLEKAKEIGLKINDRKTIYMIIGNKGNTENEILTVKANNGEVHLRAQNETKYLGVKITKQGGYKDEIITRIAAGSRCVGAYNKLLGNKNVSRKMKECVYKTIIRPTVIFAAETWATDGEMEKKLEIWERRVLRKIYGGVKEGENWRRRTNQELQECYRDKPITLIVKQCRLRWLGHIVRMKEGDLVKKVYSANWYGKNRKGRPRKTWQDCVDKDIELLNVNNWKEVAQDRKLWKQKVGGDGIVFEVINGLFERWDWSEAIKHVAVGVIPGGSGNGLARSIAYSCSEPYSSPTLPAALSAVRNHNEPMDLVRVETTSQIMFSFLSVGWGLLSDIDIESEGLRVLGGQRFALWSVARLIGLRSYNGKVYYLPANASLSPLSTGKGVTEVDNKIELPAEVHLETQAGRQRLDSWYSAASRRSAYFSTTGSSYQSTAESSGDNLDKPRMYGPASQLPCLTAPLPPSWKCMSGSFIMVHASYQTHLSADCFFAPSAKLNDGLIWLLIIHASASRSQMLQFLLGLNTGAHADSHSYNSYNGVIELIPVRAFRIEPDASEQGYMTVDGEHVEYGPIQAEVFPALARVMVP